MNEQDNDSAVVAETLQKGERSDQLQFSTALQEIWKAVSRTNKYIDETTLDLARMKAKTQLAQVLYNPPKVCVCLHSDTALHA